MTRQAVEDVLRKHGLNPETLTKTDWFADRRIHVSNWEALLKDLLAICPTPSREALEKILSSYECHTKGGRTTAHFFREELLSWAKGTEPKVWCEHITFVTDPEPSYCGFYLQVHSTIKEPLPKPYQYCPLCGAPKPEQG